MQYMLLIYGDPSAGHAPESPEGQAEFQDWMTYSEALGATGKLLHGAALQPADTATTVRVRNGETLNVDGPFAETKEMLGGYYLIDVEHLDEALEWAAKMPNINHGSVEVRPIMVFPEG